ncbi:MAG: RluA family pseudouridine synthase, partial [Proteobacteria bacterium]|nr:RluA family pseudouridine synthase [Pseudomonadota bacterium]
MSAVTTKTIPAADAGMRLDRWFKRELPELSFGQLSKLLRTGQIRIGGKRAKGGTRLEAGDQVRIPPLGTVTAAKSTKPVKPLKSLNKKDIQEIRGMVIYQDKEIIVLNKPAGLAVQGGTGTNKHIDGMLGALGDGKGAERPKLVHRLDKDTSGLLVVARNAPAARILTRAFREKECHKIYWALVRGVPKILEGKIEAPLEKGSADGAKEKMQITGEGKKSLTYYKVLDQAAPEASWLALIPETGRTHQLRAHLAHIGHPVIGDGKYGGSQAHLSGLSSRLHLHAAALSLPRPKG